MGDFCEDVYTAPTPEKGKDGGKTRQTPSAVGSGSGVTGDEAIVPTDDEGFFGDEIRGY